jgi:hypothetical protein
VACPVWSLGLAFTYAERELLQVVVNFPEERKKQIVGLGRALVCTDDLCELRQSD